jgi:hypothetical protein
LLALAARFAADLLDELGVLRHMAALGAFVIHARPDLLVLGDLELRAAAGALGDDLTDPELHTTRINKPARAAEEVLPVRNLVPVHASNRPEGARRAL